MLTRLTIQIKNLETILLVYEILVIEEYLFILDEEFFKNLVLFKIFGKNGYELNTQIREN